jgi:DNA/RNA endonuclease G (NUC1)
LPNGWVKTEGADYKASYWQRGHLTASNDRDRSQTDILSTFSNINLIPQFALPSLSKKGWVPEGLLISCDV